MMACLPAVLVLSVLISIVGQTVLTNAATKSVSVDGLPQGNATRVLPSFKPSEIDEIVLFQSEMLAQTPNSKVETDDPASDETSKAGGEKICEDLSNSFIPDIPIVPLVQDTVPKPGGLSAIKLEHDVLSGHIPLQEEQIDATIRLSPNTSSSTLGWCLDILVLAIIADGIWRWRYKNASSSNKFCDANDEWQTFMKAALAGDTAHCEALLRNGFDVARTDTWGCTVLHAAAKGGAKQVVSQLLECGSRVDDSDLWDETPLHLAARAGHTDICELLLEHSAPINVLNAQNWTPLVTAANEGREMTCKFLLNRGATAGGLADTELPLMLTRLLAEKEEFPSLLRHLDEQDDDFDPYG